MHRLSATHRPFSGFAATAILVFTGLFLAGPNRSAASSLELTIRPVFNGAPLLLDSLRYPNAAGETLSVTRLSYLLSSFALEREDGTWIEQVGRYAWFDAVKHRDTVRLDDIPNGRYRALRFCLGPDPEANAADPARFPADHALNANFNGLHWSWQGGYIFLALEGLYRARAATSSDTVPLAAPIFTAPPLSGYAYHLARDPQRTRITLTASLDLTHDAGVGVDFDLGALLNAPRPLSFARDGAATHSRDGDPVAAALVANLRGAFRVAGVFSAAPAISVPSPVKPLYLPARYTPYRLKIAASFPIPDLPRDNPLIEERVALGKALFNETALSRDGALSCASCHQGGAAFSDPRRVSLGVGGKPGTRNAMPLFNLAWKSSFFWDGRSPSLRAQILVPIQDHAEMDETLERVVAKLAAASVDAAPDYPALFMAAFGAPEITTEKLALALEQFLLTLTAHDAKFDRALRGQENLTADEQRGFELFMTENDPRTGQRGADCFHCHGGPLFSDHQFHNNGLTATEDIGREKFTGMTSDRGKFATPSLRNVARTAPYMHDGRFSTLEEVVAHYSEGVVRTPTLDPNLAKHPDGGLRLDASDQRALVAFLKTLEELPAVEARSY
jgi:cytochrome c peroxidase